MQWRGSLAALFIAMGCVSKKGMTVDLNRLILGKSYNSTKVFRTAQHVVQAILLGFVVPALILLLIWDLTDNPNPVPGVSSLPAWSCCASSSRTSLSFPTTSRRALPTAHSPSHRKYSPIRREALRPKRPWALPKSSFPRPLPRPSALPTASRCWRAGARTRQNAPRALRLCCGLRST